MTFVHQALTWGFLLTMVPVLIHLINMMRHQRVRWAAMEFLLQSYKKHRKWVWLKQLLLLLARMAAVAVLVAMLAQWITQRQWLNLFGGQSTHHYVLVDDSYSMSDRAGDASAFDMARQVVGTIATRAAEAEIQQRLTLIRFSQAARAARQIAGDAAKTAAAAADFNAESVDAEFQTKLDERRGSFDVTEMSDGPQAALELVKALLGEGTRETPIVYVVSDFRSREWEKPGAVRDLMLGIEKAGATVELVQCAKTEQNNLAVVDVQPANETRASGVPLFVNVSVKNHGPAAAQRVALKVRTIFTPPADVTGGLIEDAWKQIDELPTLIIEEIAPGETVTRRMQVFFAEPGQHVVEAELPADAVAADNRRWSVIDIPPGEPVLLVDGSPEQLQAYYLNAVFQPSDRTRTGVLPEIKDAEFLSRATPDVLAAYRAIYLMDLDRLNDAALKNVEQYVDGGGGLAVFAGDETNIRFWNDRLYRGGAGLAPLPLERADPLPAPIDEDVPDILPGEHPVFEPFLGERNPFIRWVTIDQYLRPPADWTVPAGSTVTIAARLRNRAPLVVEKQLGKGRVLVFLTTLTPTWNNWAQDPSFIVMLLRLQSYLASMQRPPEVRLVGTPVEVDLDKGKFKPDVRWGVPGAKAGSRVTLQRTAAAGPNNQLVAALGVGEDLAAATGGTTRGGVYEAWPETNSQTYELRRFALNVDPNEGDLALVDGQTLLTALAPLKAGYQLAEQFQSAGDDLGGINRSLLLMALLIGLLIGEQLLAYSASYHPLPSTGASSRGPSVRARRNSPPRMDTPVANESA